VNHRGGLHGGDAHATVWAPSLFCARTSVTSPTAPTAMRRIPGTVSTESGTRPTTRVIRMNRGPATRPVRAWTVPHHRSPWPSRSPGKGRECDGEHHRVDVKEQRRVPVLPICLLLGVLERERPPQQDSSQDEHDKGDVRDLAGPQLQERDDPRRCDQPHDGETGEEGQVEDLHQLERGAPAMPAECHHHGQGQSRRHRGLEPSGTGHERHQDPRSDTREGRVHERQPDVPGTQIGGGVLSRCRTVLCGTGPFLSQVRRSPRGPTR